MSRVIGGRTHGFRHSPISWCGEYASTGVLCFGLENGELVILPEQPSDRPSSLETGATEPINGAAFAGRHFVLTSRQEVLVAGESEEDRPRVALRRLDQVGGAHGVAASAHQEAFAVAIGVDGLLVVTPNARGNFGLQVGRSPDHLFNCGRISRLGGGPDEEAFAVAVRTDGLLVARPFQGNAPLINHHFLGHDIIDVCSLQDPSFPRAVLCVSRGRGLFFLEDALGDRPPVGLLNPDVRGVAYSIAVIAGHVFLLTDQELITFPGLASRFLGDPSSLRGSLRAMSTPSAAFELATFRGSLLLLEEGIAEEYRAADLANTGGGLQVGTEQDARLEILERDLSSSAVGPGRHSFQQLPLEISAA